VCKVNALLQEVKNMLGQLRMAGAREQLEELFLAASKEHLSLLEFTRGLMMHEVEVRNANSQRRMKQACFPEHKTMDEVDFGFQQSVSKHQKMQLMDMYWVERLTTYSCWPPLALVKHFVS